MNKIILGSGSPRRLELLSLLVDRERIEVVRPDCDELNFDDAQSLEAIEDRLRDNVLRKFEAVRAQVKPDETTPVLCADTVVVVEHHSQYRVLGKPDGDGWQDRVSEWFERYYCTGPHWVRTGFAVVVGDAPIKTLVNGSVETRVEFRSDAMELLPWYLSTGEPLGKAGGYGIQGAGSVFSERVTGSLSNVIGLPLEAVLGTLVDLNFPLKQS